MVSKIKASDQEHIPDGELDNRDFDLQLHEFQAHLIVAKARVIPLKTIITVPGFNLLELLLCC